MKRYVLGVDSGGTKYLVRAAALNGDILGEYKGSGSTHYRLGAEEAARRIHHHILCCLETFGGKPEDCAAIVSGSSGYDSPEDADILQHIYENLPGFSCPMYCMSDVVLAHYAVTCGRGVLALAGTGSVIFGRNEQGEEARIGGWLHSILSDEGSGDFLSRKALHHYSRYLDGCRERTPLIEAIEQKVGAPGRKALMDYAVKIATPPWPESSLGPALNQAAADGDEYAIRIFQEAGVLLADMADEAIRKLHLENTNPLPVGVWGSVLVNSPFEQEAFFDYLKARYPHIQPCLPTIDAAQGAVNIALKWVNHQTPFADILKGL